MTPAAAADRAPRLSNAVALTWSFIASESVFFVLLVLAFLALRPGAGSGPTAATSLDPLRTGLYSVALFASSFTLLWGERGRARGRAGRARVATGLAVTAGLGIVFLAFQALEWSRLLARGVTVRANTFGTAFYTLTGFHGLHVAIGVVILLVLLVVTLRGDLDAGDAGALPAGALYWHFVDVVWVVIYSVVYLVAAR